MKDLGTFLSNLIEKFDIKKLMICAFVVLALMVVPRINFLKFLMPLDNADKWIVFIFALITTYLILSILIYLWQHLTEHFKYKPKSLFWMMSKYGDWINLFYSEEINEYSSNAINFGRYSISQDVINKLLEKNIIVHASYNYPEYRLTSKARKKLTHMRKTITFIDSKFISKKQSEDNKNEW